MRLLYTSKPKVMVCTVTTSIVAEVTTVAASGGMIAAIGLIALLVIKELSTANEGPRSVLLSRYLNIGIMPLLIVFVFIVITALY